MSSKHAAMKMMQPDRLRAANYKSRNEIDDLPSRFNYMKHFKSSDNDKYLEDIPYQGEDEIL